MSLYVVSLWKKSTKTSSRILKDSITYSSLQQLQEKIRQWSGVSWTYVEIKNAMDTTEWTGKAVLKRANNDTILSIEEISLHD